MLTPSFQLQLNGLSCIYCISVICTEQPAWIRSVPECQACTATVLFKPVQDALSLVSFPSISNSPAAAGFAAESIRADAWMLVQRSSCLVWCAMDVLTLKRQPWPLQRQETEC